AACFAPPMAGIEISASLLIRKDFHKYYATFQRTDPLMQVTPIEYEARPDLDLSILLQPNHPFGVLPVAWLVEDLSVDGAGGVSRKDKTVGSPARDGECFP